MLSISAILRRASAMLSAVVSRAGQPLAGRLDPAFHHIELLLQARPLGAAPSYKIIQHRWHVHPAPEVDPDRETAGAVC